MTLNNLLSQDAEEWQPIVPIRRHSLPASSPTNSNFKSLVNHKSSSSALQTLVDNLRNRYPPKNLISEASDDASLLQELESRVTTLIDNGFIGIRDAPLAKSLVSLLTHISRISDLSPASRPIPMDLQHQLSTADIYDTLSQRLSELQSHRDAHTLSGAQTQVQRPPIQAVEHAILWHKVDDDLDEVLRLCRERAEPEPYSPNGSALPPEYEYDDMELPTYDPAEYSEVAATKAVSKSHKSLVTTSNSHHLTGLDEKMRMDLEAVTMAIDRLYMVAPQLSNQRVELKRSKLDQMEKARINGSSSKGKAKEILGVKSKEEKEKDIRELDQMLELISKASSRRIDDQSVVLDGQKGMAERVEKARLRDLEKANFPFSFIFQCAY